jgi:hypothetical protein
MRCEMAKCHGFERSAHERKVVQALQVGDIVKFKMPAPEQSAVEVMRRGVAAQRERIIEEACERAALKAATGALDTRPVPMGLHEESFGELFMGWCKKILG